MLRRAAVFHAVATCGSISKAAHRLGRSSPALHHDLKCLERELGRPLFERAGRSLRLSPGARRLFESVARNLGDIERELEWFSRTGVSGEVLRIAAVSGFARYRLAPALFSRADACQLELITGSHEQVVYALTSGRADVAITYKPVTAVPIVAQSFAEEEYVLLGPRDSPTLSSLQAVEELSFVTYDEYEYVFAHWFKEAFDRQPGRLRRADHTTELEEAIESVAAGRGVTVVPADAWRNGPWLSRCADLLTGERRVSNALYLLVLSGATQTTASLLREFLFKAVGSHQADNSRGSAAMEPSGTAEAKS